MKLVKGVTNVVRKVFSTLAKDLIIGKGVN